QIYKAFDVTTDVERRKIVLLVAHLTPVKNYKSIDQKYAKINIQGALILQDWVKFPSAYSTAIAEGLVAMPVATMCRWARNSTGSRVIEAVLRSSTVPVKQKRKIVFNFSTHYTEIGCDKYGSHIVDACWEASNLEVKEKILREIRDSEARFQDSPFGRHVLRNCHLESYKRSPREWLVRMRGYEKRKQIMREIIEDGNVPAADAKKDDATGKKRSKRKKRVADEIEEDEIDTLFRQQDKEDKPNKSKKRAKKRNS
ncbi:Nucleolar protein 9, partial [Spiromyces aspiralis]